ncbi:MAG: hypothetical protein RLY20_2469 [Verrucomicrobiota bacterium]|jgi:outer membrane protein
MKLINKLIVSTCFAMLLIGATPVLAQSKIGTVDLNRLFEEYWKTKQARTALNEQGAQYEKEIKGMVDQFKKDEEEYKSIQAAATDSAMSDAEREKKKSEAEKKLASLRDQDETIKKYQNQAQTRIADQRRRVRDNILGEIRKVVTAIARSGSYSLVLDVAGETVNNTPVVLFSTGENDITQSVLDQLNSSAPPEVTKEQEKDKTSSDKDKPAPKK